MSLANRSVAGFLLSLAVLLHLGAPVSANEPPSYNCSVLDGDRVFQAHMLSGLTAAQQRRRVALVIGNGAYDKNVGPLANPSSDADAVSSKLRLLGFDVVLAKDVTAKQLLECAKRVAHLAQGADVALIYYSGHGLQKDDLNFIVGVDASGSQAGLVALNDIVDPLRGGAGSLLIFLDACRNNSLAQPGSAGLARAGGRSLTRGFMPVAEARPASASRKGDLFIAYATSPGRIAADGDGHLSPFTQGFVEHIGTPGLAVQDAIAKVTHSVNERTNFEQLPWSRSSLTSPIYLNGEDDRAVVLAKSRDFAAKARARLDKADKLGAVAAALKGLPAVLSEDLQNEFNEAFKSLYGAVWSRRASIPVDADTVTKFAITKNSKKVLLERKLNFSGAASVELWDVPSQAIIRSFTSSVFQFSSDGQRAVIQEVVDLGGRRSRVVYGVYETGSGSRLFGLHANDEIESHGHESGFVSDETWRIGATRGRDARRGQLVRVWDLTSGTLIDSIAVNTIGTNGLSRSPRVGGLVIAINSGGKKLFIHRDGSAGGVIVFDMATRETSFIPTGGQGCTMSVSNHSLAIAVTCNNIGLKLLDASSGVELCPSLPRLDAYYIDFISQRDAIMYGGGGIDLGKCILGSAWFDPFSEKDAKYSDAIVGEGGKLKAVELHWSLAGNFPTTQRGVSEGLDLIPQAMQLLTPELRAEVERERIRYMPR